MKFMQWMLAVVSDGEVGSMMWALAIRVAMVVGDSGGGHDNVEDDDKITVMASVIGMVLLRARALVMGMARPMAIALIIVMLVIMAIIGIVRVKVMTSIIVMMAMIAVMEMKLVVAIVLAKVIPMVLLILAPLAMSAMLAVMVVQGMSVTRVSIRMVCDGGSFGNVGNDRSGGVDRAYCDDCDACPCARLLFGG